MVATGRIFPLQLPPGACRQLQQAGCYVVVFAQPSISAADAWMLPWGTWAAVTPLGCGRRVSGGPRHLLVRWGFQCRSREGVRAGVWGRQAFIITKGEHPIVPVRLSWYLWGKYRQKVWLSENQSLSERRAETLGVTSFAFLTLLSSLRWWDLHVILSLVPPLPVFYSMFPKPECIMLLN